MQVIVVRFGDCAVTFTSEASISFVRRGTCILFFAAFNKFLVGDNCG